MDFEKYPDNQWQNTVTNVYPVQKTSNLEEDELAPKKGALKKGSENMHFDASDPSIKMMMNLISSASDISIVFGICDYLGKTDEIDLDSLAVCEALVRVSVHIVSFFASGGNQ